MKLGFLPVYRQLHCVNYVMVAGGIFKNKAGISISSSISKLYF